ncbi:hypothetical protein JCM14469_43720 [Desulfatiferula olefinivorans]
MANGLGTRRDEPNAGERGNNMPGVTKNNQNQTLIKAVKDLERAGRPENEGAGNRRKG